MILLGTKLFIIFLNQIFEYDPAFLTYSANVNKIKKLKEVYVFKQTLKSENYLVILLHLDVTVMYATHSFY